MSKELEALRTIKRLVINKHGYGDDYQEEIDTIKQALTPPTEQEVCEALDKLWKLDKNIHTSLHFIFNKKDNEFQMVDGDNKVWRYISFTRDSEDAMTLLDLPPHLLKMVSWFYEKESERDV